MAQASYNCDLTTLTTSEVSTNFIEPTATTPENWTNLNAITSAENDFYIQQVACTSATIKVGVGGLLYNNGAGFTIPTDGAVLIWAYWWGPGLLDTTTNGGVRTMIGSGTAAFYWVSHSGSDDWLYGGWRCYCMGDPSAITVNTVGSPTATRQYAGWAYKALTAPARGNPYGVDAIRYGRATITVTAGDATEYGRFDVIAEYNDKNSTAARTGFTLKDSGYHRFGIFQYQDGVYKWQGRLLLGTTGVTAVDFRDSNRAIFVQNTKHVTTNFNLIEVQHTSSNIEWTGISIAALGTASKGRFLMTDGAKIVMTSCNFTDMDTFVYHSSSQANSTVTNTIFRRCGIVTQGNVPFTGCTFDKASGTAALIAANVGSVTNCSFISSGTGYAIQGFASAGDYTLTGITFSGYGSTGTTNAALRVTATTGTVNINAPAGTTYHSAGATVNIISGTRTLTLTGLKTGSDIVILTAGTSTELLNVDANASTTYPYSYSYASNTYVDICVYLRGYIPFIVRSYLLQDSNSSLPISQVQDRNYYNP